MLAAHAPCAHMRTPCRELDVKSQQPRPCDAGSWSPGGSHTDPSGSCIKCPAGFTTQTDESAKATDCEGAQQLLRVRSSGHMLLMLDCSSRLMLHALLLDHEQPSPKQLRCRRDDMATPERSKLGCTQQVMVVWLLVCPLQLLIRLSSSLLKRLACS